MRLVLPLLMALSALLAPTAHAQVLSVETYVEEWDNARQQWVRVEDGATRLAVAQPSQPSLQADRLPQAGNIPQSDYAPHTDNAIASYGPFHVVDQNHAEMVGITDRASPTDFAAMIRDFPALKELKLVEAPGTSDDRANMQVGRMIRAAGIATHVPAGGSVRSGAVELFLAGAERRIDDGAQFAVHSWMDYNGRQPKDFAMNAGPNRMYIEYYREMGMGTAEARAFYDMTNSVGFRDAKWLTAKDMRGWIGLDRPVMATAAANDNPAVPEVSRPAVFSAKLEAAPAMAYLDLDALLP